MARPVSSLISCVILCVTLLLAGCTNEEPPQETGRPEGEQTGGEQTGGEQTGGEQTAGEQAVSGNKSSANAEIPIQLASWEEVEQLIADERGKVVVLDVWSTWCVPCVREFPGLVALHRKFDKQVACMSLNCNFTGAEGATPEDDREQIESFLQEQGATFLNIISTDPDGPLLANIGGAAVPIVQVYDKQGELRQQFTNEEGEYGEEGFSYEEHIEPLVEELLAE